MKRLFKRFGPFRYYTLPDLESTSAWLKGCDNHGHGFEWGWRDTHRGLVDKPFIEIRIGKLWLLYFEKFKNNGFELHLLGFWWIV